MKFVKILSLIICVAFLFSCNTFNVYSEGNTSENFNNLTTTQTDNRLQYTVFVRNFKELASALNNEKVTNIEILQNINAEDTLNIDKNIVIKGNGYSISQSGLTDKILLSQNLKFDTKPLFKITGNVNTDIDNLQLIGGLSEENAYCGIEKNSDGVLTLDSVTIKNFISNKGATAINSQKGIIVMKNCNIYNNLSENSSVILNKGTMIIDGCSVIENVCYGKEKAVGVINSDKNSKLYINNSTIAKNISQGNFPAINIDGAYFNAFNSNIIGNVNLNSDENNTSSVVVIRNSTNANLVNNIIIDNVAGNKNSDVFSEKNCEVRAFYNCYTDKNKTLKHKTNKRLKADINDLIATENATDFSFFSEGDEDKNTSLKLPMFVKLPNNTSVVGIKSDTEFLSGCKTVFDYDDLENIICGYIKKDNLVLLSGEKDYNINVVTDVQGGGKRPPELVGSTLYDTLIDSNIVVISVPENKNGYVLGYNNFAKTLNKNEVVTLTAVPNKGYKFDCWSINENNIDLIGSKISDQSITISVKSNTKITPIFKEKTERTPTINLFYDYKNSFTFHANNDNTFKIEQNMIDVQDNKILTGYNTKPDGTGETYLIGKTYTTKENVVLYAMKSECGFGFLTGHTAPNSEVTLYGRDDYYLGFCNSGKNGDYVLNEVIPSFGEVQVIKNSSGKTILKNVLEVFSSTKETVLQSKISKTQDNTEEKVQAPKKVEKNKTEDLKQKQTTEKVKENKKSENDAKEENTKKEDRATDNEYNIENLNEIIDLTNDILDRNISVEWTPDIRGNKSDITKLKNSFYALSDTEKSMLDEDYTDKILNFINALDKIEAE